jgi:hypothetical protein
LNHPILPITPTSSTKHTTTSEPFPLPPNSPDHTIFIKNKKTHKNMSFLKSPPNSPSHTIFIINNNKNTQEDLSFAISTQLS